ncbi:MAG: cache domain-containing protein [Candidatus Brocadiaceae bacterium]|nr:cache domain-containing protein [Candidatus Brocadiaceae bacterium]
MSFKILGSALKDEVRNHLISVREIKKAQIENFFYERYGEVRNLSKNPLIIESLPRFSRAYTNLGFNDPAYKQAMTQYNHLLIYFLIQHGYQNILLADAEGYIVYGVKDDKSLGTNIKSREYSSTAIGEIFREGRTKLVFSDLIRSEKTKDFMCLGACPVYDQSNTLLGVVIVEIPYSKLDAIVSQRGGLGKTGEIYIVGSDKLMRSKSRFSKQNTILEMEIDTKASRDALRGNTGIQMIKDKRNLPVLSAYTPLDYLKDVQWVLLVEKDEKEVLNPFRLLEAYLFVIAAIIVVIAIIFLRFFKGKKRVTKIPQETLIPSNRD